MGDRSRLVNRESCVSEYSGVPEQSTDIERELRTLEAELKRLEAEAQKEMNAGQCRAMLIPH